MGKSKDNVQTSMEVFKADGSHMVDYAETEQVEVPKAMKGFKKARGQGDAIGGVKFTVR